VTKPQKETDNGSPRNYTFTKEFAEKGLDAIPEMLRVLINQVMQAERSLVKREKVGLNKKPRFTLVINGSVLVSNRADILQNFELTNCLLSIKELLLFKWVHNS